MLTTYSRADTLQFIPNTFVFAFGGFGKAKKRHSHPNSLYSLLNIALSRNPKTLFRNIEKFKAWYGLQLLSYDWTIAAHRRGLANSQNW